MRLTFLILLSISFTGTAQNIVCFTIEPNPNINDPALAPFTKYVDVLGCFSIYAENSITDAKVLHAAAVAAELLDNNEDGIVDDSLIEAQLISENALMPIFFQDGNAAMNTFEYNYSGNGVSAVLYNNEIDPTQTGHWGDDASVEEIMHTINHVGHTYVYPNAFSLQASSSLMTAAMDVARGGQFMSVPNNYPASAWYHYDDITCDYECMAIEYIYWAQVSNMGILNDPSTCSGIANEWEPCSPSLFQSTDVAMYALVTELQYKLPQLAPDGNYCPSGGIGIGEASANNLIRFYPNPSTTALTIELRKSAIIEITNLNGVIVIKSELSVGKNVMDISSLASGKYLISGFGSVYKLIVE
jgi:hypothetical protein